MLFPQYFAQHVHNIGPVWINVSGGDTSPWTEVGWMMDTLNHGTWNMPSGNHLFTVGVKADPFDKSLHPLIVPLEDGVFDGRKNDTQILFDANTRAMKRARHMGADIDNVLAQLEAQGKVSNTCLSHCSARSPMS
eukprot:COSAG06_NODE_1475_length_9337_cov_6.585733_11_plen_135_part_00